MRRVPALAALLAALSAGTPSSGDPVTGDGLPATASDGHVWWVRSVPAEGSRPQKLSLEHHATSMKGAWRGELAVLVASPEHLAAWDDRVWLAYTEDRPAPELFTLRAVRHPLHGGWYAIPAGRLDVCTPIPRGETLQALGAGPSGPLALVSRDGLAPRILGLEAGSWIELATTTQAPAIVRAALDGPARSWLVPGGGDGDSGVHLIVPRAGELIMATAATGATPWAVRALPLARGSVVRRVGRLGGRFAVVIDTGAGAIELAVAGSQSLVQVARADMAPGRSALLTTGDLAILLAAGPNDDGALGLRRFDLVRGAIAEPGASVAMVDQPVDRTIAFRGPLVMAMAIFLLMLVSAVRPGHRIPIAPPKGLVLARGLRRMAAGLLDLVPALFVAVFLFDLAPLEILTAPLVLAQWHQLGAWAFVAGITIVHQAVAESLRGQSLGKALLGLRVTGEDFIQPSLRRIALRSVVKLAVYAVPPLAVTMITTPNRQCVHDLVARTLVVTAAGTVGAGNPGGGGTGNE